ncbi:hypothetical protein GLP30_10865 [Photobacterium phosphoreum]|uniref:Uncharacterized protein n=1 Tax=Photobacterium phosphoreum TaxID=659 RepID=A0AAW4ZVW1_PHOPO|nr:MULTISPECIES: hypothetical protein [Photobacterium]MCD9491321.1 hypothetical protein [Photobacterium phosphoreum]MCD9502360.1 hypothetical protein [Photobacterium phosphoreum]MCD9505661.1 hypothetical protein [Photobacterium phosphoreum]MCD9518197.1 hypothetical protein [Photobacterium phosphoreum]MCD9552187.1 hypothetical protein [Photobacterium carnosum]
MNAQQQAAIETLLQINPMPLLNEKVLAARILDAECRYKGDRIGDSVYDPYKQFTMGFDCIFDMLNKVQNLHKQGYQHSSNDHLLRTNVTGHIVMIKPNKMQKVELKNLTTTITTQYEAEIKKAQESHLQSILSQANEEAEQRVATQRKATQDAAQEEMVKSFMSMAK